MKLTLAVYLANPVETGIAWQVMAPVAESNVSLDDDTPGKLP
jgi:hypothetical protein